MKPYFWTLFYFHSVIQLQSSAQSQYIIWSVAAPPDRSCRIPLLDLHGEVCWDKTLSGTRKLKPLRWGPSTVTLLREMIDSQEYFSSSNISYAHKHGHIRREENVTGSREWQLSICLVVVRREAGHRVWVSREVCWGSSGRPGHMAALGGICIKFIPPPSPNCFQPAAIKTLSDHRCLLSPLQPFVLSPLWVFAYTNSQRKKGGGCVGSLAVWAVLLCVCMPCSRAIRKGLTSKMRSAWNNLGATENMSRDFMHAWQR